MQCARSLNRFLLKSFARHLHPTPARCEASPNPWFVQTDPLPHKLGPRPLPPHFKTVAEPPPVPDNTPDVLKYLHSQLAQSPLLELSRLVVSPAIPPPPGPPLPLRAPRGRRKRGGTYHGESVWDMPNNGLWNWVVIAQVKEGTENRGSVESVVRLVRKSLLKREPPVPLAPKSRRTHGSEWVLIDGGDFAIHIMSKGTRDRYLNQVEW